MNEDIKKYEANKGKSRKEILQIQKSKKKTLTTIYWIVIVSAHIVTFYFTGLFEYGLVEGDSYFLNMISVIFGFAGGYAILSFFILMILKSFIKSLTYSKVLMCVAIFYLIYILIDFFVNG